jgi:hypothetical protein
MLYSLAWCGVQWRAFATVIMTFALHKHGECWDLLGL